MCKERKIGKITRRKKTETKDHCTRLYSTKRVIPRTNGLLARRHRRCEDDRTICRTTGGFLRCAQRGTTKRIHRRANTFRAIINDYQWLWKTTCSSTCKWKLPKYGSDYRAYQALFLTQSKETHFSKRVYEEFEYIFDLRANVNL